MYVSQYVYTRVHIQSINLSLHVIHATKDKLDDLEEMLTGCNGCFVNEPNMMNFFFFPIQILAIAFL